MISLVATCGTSKAGESPPANNGNKGLLYCST